MTLHGQHKLADNGVTTPELRQLCERILGDYGVPLIAIELVSILKSDYGKDVTPYRLANVLYDYKQIKRSKIDSLPMNASKFIWEINNKSYRKKWWYYI